MFWDSRIDKKLVGQQSIRDEIRGDFILEKQGVTFCTKLTREAKTSALALL